MSILEEIDNLTAPLFKGNTWKMYALNVAGLTFASSALHNILKKKMFYGYFDIYLRRFVVRLSSPESFITHPKLYAAEKCNTWQPRCHLFDCCSSVCVCVAKPRVAVIISGIPRSTSVQQEVKQSV